MAVVSMVVRTPWVDLSAFAIQAISFTGTKRTVLVRRCLIWLIMLSAVVLGNCVTSHV